MKIRIKSIIEDEKESFVYEIDDEKGTKTDIKLAYLETALKILNIASDKIMLRNAKAFEKFIINVKRATRYYDKMERKVVEAPNIIHREQDLKELDEYHSKYIKYDKKSKALFSLHNGWYDNFVQIAEEIKQVIDENYNLLTNFKDDKEILYIAGRIEGILDNYRKKQKTKTL